MEIVAGNVKKQMAQNSWKGLTAVAGTVELLLKRQLCSKLLFPDS